MSVIGTWNIDMNTPLGAQTFGLTLADNPPSGSMSGLPDGPAELDNVTIDGASARFTQDLLAPMKVRVTWSVEADGDELTGTAKAGIFPAQKVTGTRA